MIYIKIRRQLYDFSTYIFKGEEIMDELSKPLSFFRIIGTDDRELTTTIYYSDLDQAPEKSADPGTFLSNGSLTSLPSLPLIAWHAKQVSSLLENTFPPT